MKILITGAKGMLGTDLLRELSGTDECVGVDLDELDITDLAASLAFIKNLKPGLIINAAAYTNVDACESNADLAFKVNAIGARNMAVASGEYQIPFLHFSTDYVFDGEKGSPYIETDPANPASVYGHSKLEGENYVRQLTNRYYIVRIQWLYGKHGKNFVSTIIRAAREKGELKVVNDQWGSPTYTRDVCKTVSRLIRQPGYGTYHVTNGGIITWHAFTEEILRRANITGVKLAPCTTEEFPRPAKRPKYSALMNRNLSLCGFEPMRPYSEALADYLKECVDGEI